MRYLYGTQTDENVHISLCSVSKPDELLAMVFESAIERFTGLKAGKDFDVNTYLFKFYIESSIGQIELDISDLPKLFCMNPVSSNWDDAIWILLLHKLGKDINFDTLHH